MVAKNRKQTAKSPASQADRDKSPLVSPPGKSAVRRAGREGKGFGGAHPNGLPGARHRLGLSPSAAAKLGVTLLLGKFGALACYASFLASGGAAALSPLLIGWLTLARAASCPGLAAYCACKARARAL